MTGNDESTRLHLAAQRALWGHVPPCLRSVSVQKDGDIIRWRCVFDGEATADDFELLSMAGTELIACYPAPTTIDERMLKVPFPEKLEHLQHLVFLRHEHNYYRA